MQLRYAYGTENILEVAPSALRNATPRTDLSAEDCLVTAPEWAAATQANEGMKIYVTVCRGFVSEWLASRTTTTLPAPPVGLDAAYRLFFEHFQVHDDSVRNLIREADRQAGRQADRQGGRHPGHLVGSFDE